MHAVRGTIGYTPTAPSAEAKQESRTRFYAGCQGAPTAPVEPVETDAEISARAGAAVAALGLETIDAYFEAISVGLADITSAVDAGTYRGPAGVYVLAALLDAGLVRNV